MDFPWAPTWQNTHICQWFKDFVNPVIRQSLPKIVPKTGQAITFGSVIMTNAIGKEVRHQALEEASLRTGPLGDVLAASPPRGGLRGILL